MNIFSVDQTRCGRLPASLPAPRPAACTRCAWPCWAWAAWDSVGH